MADVKVIDITEDEISTEDTLMSVRRKALARWILDTVDELEEQGDRDNTADFHQRLFNIWLGKYSEKLRTRKTERSKLIHPATSAAIDSFHSEITSATIDQKFFAALHDDDENEDIAAMERQLRMDIDDERAGIRDAMSTIALMGAILGEACAEVYVMNKEQMGIVQNAIGEAEVVINGTKMLVGLEPFLPYQFIRDTGANTLDDSIGLARRTYLPVHAVREIQARGAPFVDGFDVTSTEVKDEKRLDITVGPKSGANVAEVLKWHGKVPRGLLPNENDDEVIEEDEAGNKTVKVEYDEKDLVEAMVWIVNGQDILLERENPELMKHRMFLYYRMDRVPGSLRGRGVAEKAFNVQMGLDGNLRAQMDATALTVHPIFGINLNLVGRGFKPRKMPGSVNAFTGDPDQGMKRLDMGTINPEVFQNTSHLESLVALATSAMDNSPVNQAASVAQAGGPNIAVTSFLKKAKSAVQNFNTDVVNPFVNLAARLFMKLEPKVYKPTDVIFKAVGTMGAMAREIEYARVSNVMKTVPAQSPGWWALFIEAMDNSNTERREQLVEFGKAMLEQAINPEPSPMEQAQIADLESQRANRDQDSQTQRIRSIIEGARASLEMAQVDAKMAETFSKTILNLATAEEKEAGTQLPEYTAFAQQLVAEANQKFYSDGTAPVDEISIAREIALRGASSNPGQ